MYTGRRWKPGKEKMEKCGKVLNCRELATAKLNSMKQDPATRKRNKNVTPRLKV
jgi:hypothetical protein